MKAGTPSFTISRKDIVVISIVVATDKAGGIGFQNKLPWQKIPRDMRHFKNLTMGHIVAMGRKTWESIPKDFKPLPGRRNIVLTQNHFYWAPCAEVVPSVNLVRQLAVTQDVFIIGGEQVYGVFLPYATRIYRTIIQEYFEADTRFPYFDPEEWKLEAEESFGPDKQSPYPLVFQTLERTVSPYA